MRGALLPAALLLLALALGCCAAPPAPAQAAEAPPTQRPSDRRILLGFRDQITNWAEVKAARRLFGWTECTAAQCTSVCAWSGVTCGGSDANHVTKLDLSCNSCAAQLEGPVYAELALLDWLVQLNLAGNALSGALPELWGANNTFLKLVELNLNDNQLTGPIPANWGVEPSFNSLFNMQLANNQLNGTIPEIFWVSETSYKELMSLNLANNQFVGTLPLVINGLITMDFLSLAGNRFRGPLPPDWGQQKFVFEGQAVNRTQALAVVMLHGNQLSGTLPPAWAASGSFTVLRTLSLDGNNFSGGLPDQWANLQAIETLTASSTGLGGPLPPWGPGPQMLTTMELAGNSFSGTIPASWAQLPNLDKVVLQPGNPRLCPQPPQGATFSLCGVSPLCSPTDLNTTSCAAYAVTPSSGGGGGGGSSFPVAAVAVPVAVVVALAAAAGVILWMRRRKQRRQQQQQEGKEQQQQIENGVDEEREFPWVDLAIPGLSSKPVGGPGVNGPDSGVNSASSGGTGKGCGFGTGDSKGFSTDLEQLPCDWRMEPEELEILKRPDGSNWQLGTGAFGVVLKAKRAGVQPVAVKVLKSSSGAAGHLGDARFAREIGILRACRDANILQFVGAFVRESDTPGERQLCLVTEFMEGGSLQAAIQHNRVSWWRNGKRIALDLARALVYLHSKRLVHLDVKSSNVLLSRDGTAKLGDLGMARLLSDQYVTGVVGTLAWSSPEMLLGQKCSQRADIFSFGVCLWEIVTGELPVRGQLRDPHVPEECPQEVDDLINRCLHPQPAQRPSARELVQLLEAIPGGQAGTRRAAQMSPQLSPAQSWQRAQPPQLQPSGSSELPSLASSDAKRRSSSPLSSGFLPPLGSAPSGSIPPHTLEIDMRSPFDQA